MTKYKQNITMMSIGEKPKIVPGGFFPEMLTKARYAVLGLGVLAAIALTPKDVKGDTLRNPIYDVSNSTPISSFVKPVDYGNLTGADGDVSSTIWVASTDLGYLLFFDGSNPTPINAVFNGKNLTGVAYLGNNKYAVCAGKNIYEGTVSGNQWNETNIIGLTTSDLTDIDYALGAYFISTQSNGIRKVLDNSGNNILVDTPNPEAYDVVEFIPGIYTNNMGQYEGETFKNLNSDGIPLGGSGNVVTANWNNATTIRGIAYFDGGIAVVQNPGVQIHNEQAYQQYMQPIPEPDPLGSPLDDVHDSTPIASFAKPADYGNLTGADGDVSSSIWYATTTDGFILAFDGMNSTPINVIDTGYSLTGIAYKGNNQFALCAGKNIYEGTVSGNQWNRTNIIGLTTSDLTDIDFALGHYFISTQSNGIRKVLGDGSTIQVANGVTQSFDITEFKPNTYDNPMSQASGNLFSDVDLNGNQFGSGKIVNLHESFTIRGVAYYDGGFSVVQSSWIDIHNPEDYQQYMQGISQLERTLRADFDKNGIVDELDLAVMYGDWLSDSNSIADIYIDEYNRVDFFDFSILANEWLKTEQWYQD